MSEQIKYEAVFGDQTLFDDADPDVVLVETNGVYRTFHKESDSRPYNIASVSRSDLAMRRIIKTPVWTKADQEAGRLPEVGALVSCANDEICEFVGESIHDDMWSFRDLKNKNVFHLNIKHIKPIETPEERAKRVREEWCANAAKQLKNLEYSSTLTSIYEALLSGELKMPEVQK